MTPGCTTESCDFRDSYDEFAAAGYAIVGVSPDRPSLNKKFQEKEGLNFDLLSAEDHALADSLGALGDQEMYGKPRRGRLRARAGARRHRGVDPLAPPRRLGAASPSSDAADGSLAPALDADGQAHLHDPATPNTGVGTPDYADMGAFESQGPP